MHLKNYLQIFILIAGLSACQNGSEKVESSSNTYPEDAKQIEFKQIGDPLDSLDLVHEIDIFSGSQVPVGEIVDMVAFGDNIYFADRKQNNVHVIDRKTLQYKDAIGGPGPDQFYKLFGLYTYGDHMFIGDGAGPNLFKRMNTQGDSLVSYRHNDPPLWFISSNINNFFIADSFAYVTKAISDNGKKVIRYNIRGGEANKIDDIVPIHDLHAVLDSATASKTIASFYLLKSNKVDSLFYALPGNKYLVVTYDMNGVKQEAIDLRSIPEIDQSFKFLKNWSSTFFQSATIDQDDTIYFPIVSVDDPEKATPEDESIRVSMLAVNMQYKTYRTYKMETRGVSPLKIIDGKLWCYDLVKSQLVAYRLP